MPRTARTVLAGRPAKVGGLVVASALLLAGCQKQSPINREPQTGATTASVEGGVQNVVLVTDLKYRFTPSTVTVHPGKVRITVQNVGKGGAPHDWQLQSFPADYVPLTQGGQSKSVEFTAPAPGTYTFVCTIHVNQGQTGTLVVLPN
ncbi:MAG: blue (type 1) copper domain protein [Frankiales bacterium]|nr:blue (type 1) copper domain protein [Frankiales bacterium]